MTNLVHTNEDARLEATADQIARAALKDIATNPVTEDAGVIEDAADLAEYCLIGCWGWECETVAEKLDLDVHELTTRVRELIEQYFDADIHTV